MNKKLFFSVLFATAIGSLSAAEEAKTAGEAKPVNLALGAKATASSLEGNKPQVQACYAVDGDFKTRWGSGTVRPPAWIMLDFETPKTFKTVRLFWGRSHAAIYNLEISDDGKNWQKLYEQKECNGGVENIPLEKPVTTRYFRVLCLKPATGWGYNIFEIQLFEK